MFKKLTAVLWLGGALLLAETAHAQSTPPPAPWQWTDVGVVGTSGDVHISTHNEWFVSGAGSDIWGTADSFVFAYQPIRDGSIFATVDNESNTNPFAKAGVMIRQTLDASSPEVILDVKPDGGIEFMKRSSPGGETIYIGGAQVPVSPDGSGGVNIGVSLMLSRLGNSVSATYCDSSGACTRIGTTDFVEGPALIGIAVTSHDPSVLNHAYFRTPPTVNSVPATSVDVGDVGTAGDATYENATGRFFVSGAGSDIWGTADSFHYVWRSVAGDTQLTARVVSEDGTQTFAKAGLTIGNDTPDSARVILDVKPDGGIEFMARQTGGAPMTFIAGSSGTFPVWLRLTWAGDQFTGEMSPDGQAWTTVGSVTVANSSSTMSRGGFAVTSHDPATLNDAIFDNFGLTTGFLAGPIGPNLLVNAGFEDSIVPATGPGWVSDTPLRQTPAVTETALPHGGLQNAACHTTSGDCGIYQEVNGGGLSTGNLLFSGYALADHPGALVGVSVDGKPGPSAAIPVGGYQPFTFGFFLPAISSNPNPVIRVWMYAPPGGVAAIDDTQLVEYFGPR